MLLLNIELERHTRKILNYILLYLGIIEMEQQMNRVTLTFKNSKIEKLY